MNAADARRRWLGLFFLTVAVGLLLCGQTILRPHLEGFTFAVYWLCCFGFTFVTLGIALLDLRTVRRRLLEEHRQQQAELLQRTLDDLERLKKAPSPDGEPPDSRRQSS